MQIVGYVNSWVQPISARVMMQDTGIQTPVGIKVKGPTSRRSRASRSRSKQLLRGYPGTQSVIAERISEGYFIDVEFDPQRLAAAGITAEEAMPVVRYAIGGDNFVTIKRPTTARRFR